MADNAGKPGDGPTSGESSRASVRSYERGALSRPPPARRDPRADPDDEPISERVDVVTMDRSGGGGDRNSTIDSLTNAALTLRRELAKLHQQAAAVERTIEDQRRERSDAIERAEFVHQKNTELEQRAINAEAEVANLKKLHDQLKAERDDVARGLEAAKTIAEELERTREELAATKREKEDVVRAAATFENEISEIRRREQAGAQKATDAETELQSTRERLERTLAELTSAREELTQSKAETVRARQESTDAGEVAAQKLSESEHERLAAKEQIDRLEKTIAELKVVQEKVVVLDADLTNARMELVNARSEIGARERDIEEARHARDVATERATMAEKETGDVRKEVERLQAALDSATQSASNANARASAAERARVATEESVRGLRDEITTAFARWRSATPSMPPPSVGPSSVAPATRAVPISEYTQIPQAAPIPRESAPPPAPRPAFTGSSSATAPPSAQIEVKEPFPKADSSPVEAKAPDPKPAKLEPKPMVSGPPPPPEPETRPVLDDEPIAPSRPPRPSSTSMRAAPRASVTPGGAGSTTSSATSPSQSKLPSVAPPPASASMRASKPPSARMPSVPPAPAVPAEARAASIPPLHPRSVAPPAPPKSIAPISSQVPGPRSVPPPLPLRASPSMPPVVVPSVPPPSGMSQTPAQSTSPTAPPPKFPEREESSVVTYVDAERADLIERLGSPKTSREAAITLREHPDWLRGRPPIELLLALTLLDYDIEEPVFDLARAWDRDPLCRALIAALRDEPEPKLREHAAWLLKHLGAAASWPALAELVSNEEEAPSVRRWLLEAIERLVAMRGIGWTEVGDLCQRLIKHGNSSLRDGAIGVIAALDRSDDKRRLLLEVLRTDSDEVVLASAVQALTTALPIELDPSVAERLLGHPSARVQQSVVEFIERSKRASKTS